MRRIVETGRAFWRDRKRAPLSWGETREGRIEWGPWAGRGVSPHLVPGCVGLNAEPPVYVDEANGVIGPVRVDLPARLRETNAQHRFCRDGGIASTLTESEVNALFEA